MLENVIMKEVNLVIEDNERVKRERLRWVMNQSGPTRLQLEMELEQKRIKEEHERALSSIDSQRRRLEEEAEILR